MKIVFIGATRNYFKVGYTAINEIASKYPWVEIRLAIPHADQAKSVSHGIDIEFVDWDPRRPETLSDVFEGCDATLLVPPIHNRIQVVDLYLKYAKEANIKFMVCIGVQHQDNLHMKVALEAKIVEIMLQQSGIPHCVLNLPVFLENLLYHMESIKNFGEFYYPCKPESKFSYIGCADLGSVVAYMLVNQVCFADTKWTANEQTSCAELAKYFSIVLNKTVRFVQISDEDFVESLLHDTGSASSRHAAEGILEFWKEIDAGQDLPSNDQLAKIIGKEPTTALEWIRQHRCCFSGLTCNHPHPPSKLK